MNKGFRPLGGRARIFGFAALAAALLVGAFSSAAMAAPPVNTALPTISSTTPEVGKTITAKSGSWTSDATAHWTESGAPLKEGEKAGVTVNGTMMHFAATIAGIKGEVDCHTTMSGASLENPSGGGGGVGNLEITYTSCSAVEEWSKCTVTPGSTVPVKVELTKGDNVTLAPVEGNIAELTMSGKNCIFGSSYTMKLVGLIDARFANVYPRIEFNPETSSTGSLRVGSKFGAKVSSTGAIGFVSGAENDIGTDALIYGYQWKRCTGEACTEISGATNYIYTPSAEDWGKTLKATVTATDANGSTQATSAATSAVKGTPNWYVDNGGWETLTSAPFTSSNMVKEGEGGKSIGSPSPRVKSDSN